VQHPQTEAYWGNVNPIGPRSCYDEGKRAAETLCYDYNRMHGVEVRLVRIFNTYGPRMRMEDGRAIPAFISQALSNEDVTVFGAGSQTRSVCYVDDLIEGIYRLLLSGEVMPVNIGNPDELTMMRLAEEIIALIGSKSKIVFKELPQDDPKIRQPDTTRAKKILNWEAKINRREGLLKTIEYFRSQMK
jgi:nucleoside-diphosphate-sugar epimerase